MKFPDILPRTESRWALPIACNFSLSLSVNNVYPSLNSFALLFYRISFPVSCVPLSFFPSFFFVFRSVFTALAFTLRFNHQDSIKRCVSSMKRSTDFLINSFEIYVTSDTCLSNLYPFFTSH